MNGAQLGGHDADAREGVLHQSQFEGLGEQG